MTFFTRHGMPTAAKGALVALTAAAVAACGGSTHKHSSIQQVAAAPATVAAATTTATTAAKTHTQHPTAGKDRAHPKAGGPGGTPSNNGTAVNPSNTHPSLPGPKPLACLASAGLLQPRAAQEANVWEANGRVTKRLNDPMSLVFVDGPYKTEQRAATAVSQVKSIELAKRGGLYRVTAALPSGLGAPVAAVARCLGGPGSETSTSKSYAF